MGASGDQTFIRINDNLVNAETLSVSTIVADSCFLGQWTLSGPVWLRYAVLGDNRVQYVRYYRW